jgi:hypothetical protein
MANNSRLRTVGRKYIGVPSLGRRHELNLRCELESDCPAVRQRYWTHEFCTLDDGVVYSDLNTIKSTTLCDEDSGRPARTGTPGCAEFLHLRHWIL